MRHTIPALLALFLGLIPPAWSQGYDPQMDGLNPDIRFIIRGRVLFDPKAPPSGPVEVRLEGIGRDAIANVYADGIGNFEFKDLNAGTFHIFVRTEGFDEVRQRVEVTRGAEQIITAMITINRAAAAPDDATSGSDPNLVDLTEFRKTYPAAAVRAHDRALDEREKGNLSKAIELLKEAIELAPDFYRAHNTLGLIYQQSGQPNEARREFLVARELNPRSADPLINLGRLYLQAGDAEESFGNRDQAVETFGAAALLLGDAVKLNPRNAVGYYFLGSALYKTGQLELARAALGRSKALDDSFLPSYLMLANVYLKLEHFEMVLAELDAYLAKEPPQSERQAAERMRSQVQRMNPK